MESNCMHQRHGKTPDAHQVRAHLRMRATHVFEFQTQDGAAFGSKNLAILAEHFGQQNHLSDIVQ